MNQAITLIAHRGLPERYPENSLTGIQAALSAGAKFVEVDIQFSSDCIPYLYHDENLHRMTGIDRSILQTSAVDINQLMQRYPPNSFPNSRQEPVAPLEQLVTLMAQWPECRFFLELKRHSVEQFGAATCVRKIQSIIEPVSDLCVPISFHAEAIKLFQSLTGTQVGWIIREWNKDQHRIADDLKPDFMFCNYKKLPQNPTEIWQGPWQWILYTVNENDLLQKLNLAGFSMIETNRFDELQSQL